MPESLTRPVVRTEAEMMSYEEYVTLRWPALYRTAYLMTGSHADAEDLVQSALVKVYGAWAKVSRADSVDAYVRRVLVNTFVSGRRPVRFTRERIVAAVPERAAVVEGDGRRLHAPRDGGELLGEQVVDAHERAPSMRARRDLIARLALDLTVPGEQPRASAICCSLRSS